MGKTYKLEQRPASLGGGYKVTFFDEDGEEAGAGIFPLGDYDYFEDSVLAMDQALADAESEGEAFVQGLPGVR
jgi:hypothetical protein